MKGIVALFVLGSLGMGATAQVDSLCQRYQLVVKTSEALQPGLTRYSIEWAMPEADRLSALFGTNLNPMTLLAPEPSLLRSNAGHGG